MVRMSSGWRTELTGRKTRCRSFEDCTLEIAAELMRQTAHELLSHSRLHLGRGRPKPTPSSSTASRARPPMFSSQRECGRGGRRERHA